MKKICCLLFVLMILVTTMFTGCHLMHDFSEATCTAPATCRVCGETEGEALGHTTEFGKCGGCGEKINGELFEQIKEIYPKTGAGSDFFSEMSTSYLKATLYIDSTDAVEKQLSHSALVDMFDAWNEKRTYFVQLRRLTNSMPDLLNSSIELQRFDNILDEILDEMPYDGISFDSAEDICKLLSGTQKVFVGHDDYDPAKMSVEEYLEGIRDANPYIKQLNESYEEIEKLFE